MVSNIIVLLGPPLSGKGTISRVISSVLDCKCLNFGFVLKKCLQSNKSILQSINKGNRVDDNIAINILEENLPSDNNLILDGYPRSLGQAKHIAVDHNVIAVELKVQLSEVLKRVNHRFVCSICGASTIKKYTNKKCECGCSSWIKRLDDSEEIAANRYNEYLDYCDNILHFYLKQDKLITVDSKNFIKEDLISQIKQEML